MIKSLSILQLKNLNIYAIRRNGNIKVNKAQIFKFLQIQLHE